MEFKKTWSRMGNAPSKIPLKFGADPGILIRGGGYLGVRRAEKWLRSRYFHGGFIGETFGTER